MRESQDCRNKYGDRSGEKEGRVHQFLLGDCPEKTGNIKNNAGCNHDCRHQHCVPERAPGSENAGENAGGKGNDNGEIDQVLQVEDSINGSEVAQPDECKEAGRDDAETKAGNQGENIWEVLGNGSGSSRADIPWEMSVNYELHLII